MSAARPHLDPPPRPPPRSRARALAAVCGAVIGAGACGGGPGTAPAPELDRCADVRALRTELLGGPRGFLTEEEEADLTARLIPGGFGGLFQDLATATLVVYLQDLSQQEQAVDALRELLTCGAVYPGWAGALVTLAPIRVMRGEYTATELLAFLRALAPLRADPEVWGLVVDPETNRIWIGVENAAALARIQREAKAVVPFDALFIEIPPLGAPLPPADSFPFEVLQSPVPLRETAELPGAGAFDLQVRYHNRALETRYLDQCAPQGGSANPFFRFTLSRWDGAQWVQVHTPVCEVLALRPRGVESDSLETDTTTVGVSRRLALKPFWQAARLTGTYRLEGFVYLSMTNVVPFVANLAPLAERVSTPFRLIR